MKGIDVSRDEDFTEIAERHFMLICQLIGSASITTYTFTISNPSTLWYSGRINSGRCPGSNPGSFDIFKAGNTLHNESTSACLKLKYAEIIQVAMKPVSSFGIANGFRPAGPALHYETMKFTTPPSPASRLSV